MQYRSRIHEIMVRKGLSVAQVAAGFPRPRLSSQVYRYVNGEINPTMGVLAELTIALGVSADDIIAPIGAEILGRRSPAAV